MSEAVSLIESREALLANFKCQGTGKCCEAEGYVYVTPQDIAGMAGKLEMSVEDFRAEYVRPDGKWEVIASPTFRLRCFLDDNNHCRVYEHRPEYCREYPHCPELWQSESDAHTEIAKCKGLQLAYAAVFKQTYTPNSAASAKSKSPESPH